MNEEFMSFLNQLLTAVLTAAIPIISTFVIQLIRTKVSSMKDEIENNTISTVLTLMEDLVVSSIEYVDQTVVYYLKEKGLFDRAEQQKAFDMCLNRVKELMSPTMQNVIEVTYGDLDDWLEIKIESLIKQIRTVERSQQ